jgi:serine/threonine protein kinase
MPGEGGATVIGRQLGHYIVLTKIGQGGMGDVYVARDTRLDRRVALKLPRLDVAAPVDRLALFQREARAAAALNHRNIVHLYSVEEADGLIFMTMELVQGRSLRDIMSGRIPLAPDRAIRVTTQIAEGLACAHAAGVLHRDLKPGNVMLTEDDTVKILDFGVAKFFKPNWESEQATTAARMTGGMMVGTVGYMSPEQALGRNLDARTDLFALGVMLFEMATGRLPFEGDTPAVVFDQLLNRRHLSPLTVNPGVPPRVVSIIDKALEKDPERRYRSADEFLADLRRSDPSDIDLGGSTASPRPAGITSGLPAPPSIVVLPFADLSPGRDQEYFCHGITEEIINALTQVPGLRVISRTSAFAFQGRDLEVTEIGRRLRVGTAVEGSVRKAGDRVRVTAQLVNAENGYQLWSKRFDRELSDIFAIQDEIAAIIMSELRIELGGEPAVKPSFDVLAHDAYLKGMYALNRWTADSMQRAIAEFRDAMARDPGFAPAYVAFAEGTMWLYSGLGGCPQDSWPHRHEPRLGSQGSRGGDDACPPARAGGGGCASLECLAPGPARTAA